LVKAPSHATQAQTLTPALFAEFAGSIRGRHGPLGGSCPVGESRIAAGHRVNGGRNFFPWVRDNEIPRIPCSGGGLPAGAPHTNLGALGAHAFDELHVTVVGGILKVAGPESQPMWIASSTLVEPSSREQNANRSFATGGRTLEKPVGSRPASPPWIFAPQLRCRACHHRYEDDACYRGSSRVEK